MGDHETGWSILANLVYIGMRLQVFRKCGSVRIVVAGEKSSLSSHSATPHCLDGNDLTNSPGGNHLEARP